MQFEQLPQIEKKERLAETAFTVSINKEALKEERDKVAPEGLHVFDTILRFPEKFSVPKETTLIIGPNGCGKSTLLGLFWLMGETAAQFETMNGLRAKNEPEVSLEQARDDVLKFSGMGKVEVKKLGLAPLIAKYTSIMKGVHNIGIAYIHRIPEQAGRIWLRQEEEETGNWEPDVQGRSGAAVFRRGKTDPTILGSTQQIIDKRMELALEENFTAHPDDKKPRLILLDEPTENADLNRTLGYLRELDNLNKKHKRCATFVVATNDPLLTLHRNVPRIDFEHPERGVHYLRDFPLDDKVRRDLEDIGYAPIEK